MCSTAVRAESLSFPPFFFFLGIFGRQVWEPTKHRVIQAGPADLLSFLLFSFLFFLFFRQLVSGQSAVTRAFNSPASLFRHEPADKKRVVNVEDVLFFPSPFLFDPGDHVGQFVSFSSFILFVLAGLGQLEKRRTARRSPRRAFFPSPPLFPPCGPRGRMK